MSTMALLQNVLLKFKIMNKKVYINFICLLLLLACKPLDNQGFLNIENCDTISFKYNNEQGCDGKTYIDPNNSPYVLPFPPGTIVKTGLTNCSKSYHGAAYPDRYAFDFNVDVGTPFYATRGGKVVLVINDQPSNGGGNKSGNWLIIDHKDNTYSIYLHSPKNGIEVNIGDNIKQGDLLGKTGRSGLAGYPHLHYIVVQNGYDWPYDAIPISFSNVMPRDVILKSNSTYTVCNY